MPRTRVVIQSRLNSSRLPGKAMLTIGGMPLIELVARRAGRSGHEVVVATSAEQYDERIAGYLRSVGVDVVRGSLDDVLGRFVQATADLDPTDRVVRLTGDNPLADADLVDELITAAESSGHRYGRVDIERVPEGLGAEVFDVRGLREAAAQATAAYDREHVTPWLRRSLGEYLFVPADCPDDVFAYRATVDTLGDYVRVSSLFDGETDPVGRPWLALMTRLADRVDRAGARVAATATDAGRVSRVILSARSFEAATHGERPAERAEHLRTLVAEAIERGVTHIDVGRGDGRSEELLHACAEPALVKRFGVICRTAPHGVGEGGELGGVGELGEVVDDLAVEASVERSFANLGRRGVDVLVFTGSDAAARGWARARAYRDERLVSALGLVAEGAADLAWALATPDVAYVEVRGQHARDDPALTALAGRGCALTVSTDGGPLPPWATSELVTSVERPALDAAIAAAAL
ncbi:MAG: NTP transferase domain-containing protein [Humibacillus sp.]